MKIKKHLIVVLALCFLAPLGLSAEFKTDIRVSEKAAKKYRPMVTCGPGRHESHTNCTIETAKPDSKGVSLNVFESFKFASGVLYFKPHPGTTSIFIGVSGKDVLQMDAPETRIIGDDFKSMQLNFVALKGASYTMFYPDWPTEMSWSYGIYTPKTFLHYDKAGYIGHHRLSIWQAKFQIYTAKLLQRVYSTYIIHGQAFVGGEEISGAERGRLNQVADLEPMLAQMNSVEMGSDFEEWNTLIENSKLGEEHLKKLVGDAVGTNFWEYTEPVSIIEESKASVEKDQPVVEISKNTGEAVVEAVWPAKNKESYNELASFDFDNKAPIIEVDAGTKKLTLHITGGVKTEFRNAHGITVRGIDGPVADDFELVINNPAGIFCYNCTAVGYPTTFVADDGVIQIVGPGMNSTHPLTFNATKVQVDGPMILPAFAVNAKDLKVNAQVDAQNILSAKLSNAIHNQGWLQAAVVLLDAPEINNKPKDKGDRVAIIAQGEAEEKNGQI